MTDMSKYKNVSLTKETYAILDKLSKVLLPDAKLSVAKTIESLANTCTNVGTVIRRESFMKLLMIILLTIVCLTSCTKINFDSFDPTTGIARWIITNDSTN